MSHGVLLLLSLVHSLTTYFRYEWYLPKYVVAISEILNMLEASPFRLFFIHLFALNHHSRVFLVSPLAQTGNEYSDEADPLCLDLNFAPVFLWRSVEIGWDRLSRGDMPRSTVLWHHRVICPRARRSWQDGPARFEGCKTIDLFWKSRMIGNPMTETDHLDVVYIKNPFMVILDDWRDGL